MMAPEQYQALAIKHRPDDARLLALEAQRLRKTGLTPRDIATAFRLDLGEALALLRMQGTEGIPR